jgi:FlaA1/EpsC-like NDP-sugar epimerase
MPPADWLSTARRRLVDLPRRPKRALLVLNDLALLSLALWLALSLRLSTFYWPASLELSAVLAAAPLIGVATFYRMSLYRMVTRFIGGRGSTRIFVAVGLATMLWALLVLMSGQAMAGVPRSVVLIYGVLSALLVWASRQIAGFLLKGLPNVTLASFDHERKPVAIYGAGTLGIQLAEALRGTNAYQPVGFIDETRSLWGQNIAGLKVYRPAKIAKLVERDGVREVMLAMPEATRRQRREIIRELTRHRVLVKTLPAMEDVAAGRVSVSDLRALDVDDLLGRDPVPPDVGLLERNVRGKAVLVTGAGGSIGSELARQILRLRPASLVLLELSEPALYQIELELREQLAARQAAAGANATPAPLPEIAPVLGSVLDARLVRAALERWHIQTIFHAAAYKHVPMVEQNPAAGIANNVLGTKVLAEAARACGTERCVLISTDKAVRPTSVMGASKRMAELILQAHAAEAGSETVFAMVRFGNVLDSSGSVVRRFRKQIEAGGPVTVTDREVIRYFMSIPEAAELVIQAGGMASGGEVFVLDMGEPVKIDQLARSMIRLMGLEVQDAENPDGDIAIKYVGLRPGEKLYEELLIGENTTRTEHARISMSHEPHLARPELERELQKLAGAIASGDATAMRGVLAANVEGYEAKADTERGEGGSAGGEAPWQGPSRTVH